MVAILFGLAMTLVPAVLTLLGRTAWKLPGRLDRLLPNLDIEGGQLPAHPVAQPPPEPQPPAGR
jgi:RND superfamily putative drug exporter